MSLMTVHDFRSCEKVLLDAGVAGDGWRNDTQCVRSDESLHQLPGQRRHQCTTGETA